ncbi:hypothetical protein [Dactylosporangium sp. CA-092794]|uniref:hypothetical protein n=1 Tax=Dactylosporangium sp. CA-092794 TaxID=3239929 RepID=UPI003D8E78E2
MTTVHADRQYLLNLADRCERGAAELDAEAADPRGMLTDRGYNPDSYDLDAMTVQKTAAAGTARAYAEYLRSLACTGTGPVPDGMIRQAETVADAANLGGILIDGRPTAEATATAPNAHIWHAADKNAWEAGTHPTQTKAAAVDGTGAFVHIADEGQVPFWHLGHTDQTHPQAMAEPAAQADNADDADGM